MLVLSLAFSNYSTKLIATVFANKNIYQVTTMEANYCVCLRLIIEDNFGISKSQHQFMKTNLDVHANLTITRNKLLRLETEDICSAKCAVSTTQFFMLGKYFLTSND